MSMLTRWLLLVMVFTCAGCGPIVQKHKRTETEESLVISVGGQKFEDECRHQKRHPKHSEPKAPEGT